MSMKTAVIRESLQLNFRRALSLLIKNRRHSYSAITELAQKVSPRRHIPGHIERPPYARTGHVEPSSPFIEIKNAHQIEAMRRSCRTARSVLNIVREEVKEGVTTDELDKLAHEAAIEHGAYPSPLNYKGFPKSVCTSVNNVAVHGIPDSRPLEDGDIISVDVSVYIGGVHGDMCETFLVGQVDEEGCNLVDICRQCLEAAIAACGPGVRFSMIGKTISSLAKKSGFSVCHYCCGHGIGSEFHAKPEIRHDANNMPGKMSPGITFTIEPVLCEGSPEVVTLKDGWTVVSQDSRRAAQFEHTVLITEHGVEILTADWNCPPASPEDLPNLLECWRPEQKWSDGSVEFFSQTPCLDGHFFDQVAELEKLVPVEATDDQPSWALGEDFCQSEFALPPCGSGGSSLDNSPEGFEHSTSHQYHGQSISCVLLASGSLVDNREEGLVSVGNSDLLQSFWCSDEMDEELSEDRRSSGSPSASAGSTSDDTKVLEKRKRNNEASRKFRRKKKSTHRTLFAKAEKLERDNFTLKLQVEELSKELGSLKALLGLTFTLPQ